MKKKVVVLSILMALTAIVIGGATFAWLTDEAINTNNSIQTGNVEIIAYRDNYDTVPGPMFYTTAEQGRTYDDKSNGTYPTGVWLPGDHHERYLLVYNYGSLPVKITRIKAAIESGLVPDTDEYNEFIDNLFVKVTAPGGNVILTKQPLRNLLGTGASVVGTTINLGTMTLVGGMPYYPNVNLAFECTLDTSAGDLLQSVSPVFTLSVEAAQQNATP